MSTGFESLRQPSPMKQAWLELPERSNLFWLNTINWITLRAGRWLSCFLLYPITAYFVVFSFRTRKASRDFLRRVFGHECGWADVFRHYHTFACTLLDRIYMFAGQGQRLDIRMHGLEVLDTYTQSGRGCLLVGAHLGSFEIIRAVGLLQSDYRIKALVYGEGTPRITSLYQKLNPSLFKDIIYMGDVGSLIGLDEHAHQGGIIALMGDRSVHSNKQVRCEFFGEPAWFPEAPALLSRILDMPLVLFFCLHQGDGRYEVRFEHLADPQRVSRHEREAAVHNIMQNYASRLEHYCRLAPYNWFNFYDFWHLGE
ncbi:MAG: lipid A biosynthesis acyltransferase [Methylococcaceae bacterium]|nr:lipid A biosynthesis acyltransferase [Methylococcaceae bacterium]MDZ4157741.1 lipid A biosynthesis acyltransferase [Methylococcales bacterium]MDP2392084.1 lipid A biosynthesis acyltransferase [Methylococcaceae bacterium]MDP3020864.1 lipid A biosynthesis acyltransferase [Methylococcaceae bacterium]MDP3391682.1 lipid A biosynthesis acyltransferase [Methylococcaceae bacterium]